MFPNDSYHIDAPAVPLQRKPVHRRRSLKRLRLKQRMLEEDSLCYWCGKQLNIVSATFDHLLPLSKQGTNKRENVVLACRKCNNEKGNDIWEKQ